MEKIRLSANELRKLSTVLSSLEKEHGEEYVYIPDKSAYACKCSGPAQSCVWH